MRAPRHDNDGRSREPAQRTVLDLFSGIGGFALGLERTGKFKTIAFCEVDGYCSKVLKQWWPAVPNFDCGIVGLNALLRRARTSSRRASPARIYPSLAQAPDLPESVLDSSGRYCEPFAWYDRSSRSWRTWQRCLLEGWEVFSGTWPRSGMTRSGIAFRRQPLVPLTAGTGSGSLLPTPRAEGMDAMGADPSKSLLLAQALWPTPTTSRGGSNNNSAAVRERGHGTNLVGAVSWPTPRARMTGAVIPARVNDKHRNLETALAREMFPSPAARDWRSGAGAQVNGHSKQLPEVIGGQLNPTWVEWLMGFPHGWTDLGRSATPSSRKSRKS